MRGIRVPRWVMLSSSCLNITHTHTVYILYTCKSATAKTLSPARNVAVAQSLPIRENGLLDRHRRAVRSTV